MRRVLVRSPAFLRDLRAWLKSRPKSAEIIEATLDQLSADAAHPSYNQARLFCATALSGASSMALV